MKKGAWGVGMVLVLAGHLAYADTITVDGTRYSDVIIDEMQTRYYVMVPTDGTVFSVSTDSVDAGSVVISSDEGEREALRKQWYSANEQRKISHGAPTQPAFSSNDSNDTQSARSSRTDSAEPMQPGVVERKVYVDEKGTKTVVMKGNYEPDPSFQMLLAERRRLQEERALAMAQEEAAARRLFETAAIAAMLSPRPEHNTSVEANPVQSNGVVINNENQNVATAIPIIANPRPISPHPRCWDHRHPPCRPCPPRRVIYHADPQPSERARTDAWLRNHGSYY